MVCPRPAPAVYFEWHLEYLYGNVNPRDLCRNYLGEKREGETEEWAILQLGVSDLFSLAFTLWKNAHQRRSSKKLFLNVVACDIIPKVIARHLIILRLLLDPSLVVFDTHKENNRLAIPIDMPCLLWEIMFNIAVSKSTLLAIQKAAKVLCAEAGVKNKAGEGGFVDGSWEKSLLGRRGITATGDTEAVGRLLWGWGHREDNRQLQTVLSEMKNWQDERTGNNAQGAMGSQFAENLITLGFSQKDVTSSIWMEYWRRGFVPLSSKYNPAPSSSSSGSWKSGPRKEVNPTFLTPNKPIRLHYLCHPFLAFHKELLLASNPGPLSHSTLRDRCYLQFSTFLNCLWSAFSSVDSLCARVCFYVGDALQCCDSLRSPPRSWHVQKDFSVQRSAKAFVKAGVPVSFHTIDTSNLGDFLGAVPLLLAASPLLNRSSARKSGVLSSVLVMDLMQAKSGEPLASISESLLHLPLSLLPLLFRVALDDHRVSLVKSENKVGQGNIVYREATVTNGVDEECAAQYEPEGHCTFTPRTMKEEVSMLLSGRGGLTLCYRALTDVFDLGQLKDSPQMVEELGKFRRECLRIMQGSPMGACTWVRALEELGLHGIVGLQEDLGLLADNWVLAQDRGMAHFGSGLWIAEVLGEVGYDKEIGEMREIKAQIPEREFLEFVRKKCTGRSAFKVTFVVTPYAGKKQVGESSFPAEIAKNCRKSGGEGYSLFTRVPSSLLSDSGVSHLGITSYTYAVYIQSHPPSPGLSTVFHLTKGFLTSKLKSNLFSPQPTNKLPSFRNGGVSKIAWHPTFTRFTITLSDTGREVLGNQKIRVVAGFGGWDGKEAALRPLQASCCLGIEVVGGGLLCSLRTPISFSVGSVRVKMSRAKGWLEVSVPPCHYTPLTNIEEVADMFPRTIRSGVCGPSPALSAHWMQDVGTLGGTMNKWMSTMLATWEREELEKGNPGFASVQFKDSLMLVFGTLLEDVKRMMAGTKSKQKQTQCSWLCLAYASKVESGLIAFSVSPALYFDSNSLFVLPVGVCEVQRSTSEDVYTALDGAPASPRTINVSSLGEYRFWKNLYLPLCYALAAREPSPSYLSEWVGFPTKWKKDSITTFQPALLVPLFSGLGGLNFQPLREDPMTRVEKDFAGLL